MTREHTLLNLAIGLFVSLLLHAYMVLWGLPFSLPMFTSEGPSTIEVQLQEWPVPAPPLQELEGLAKVEEPSPPAPVSVPPDTPLAPPDTASLQQAVQEATGHARPESMVVRRPDAPPPAATVESATDALRTAQSLADALRRDPAIADLSLSPRLPEAERVLPDSKDLPPLPAVERRPQREAAPSRPATVALPTLSPAVHIRGPAAERQVIYQPPPPSAMVESETEIELRFWILPNGSVSRVVPLKKSDPRLETLAINYLRNWRFNPLPPSVLPEEQWGVIPFKFRIR